MVHPDWLFFCSASEPLWMKVRILCFVTDLCRSTCERAYPCVLLVIEWQWLIGLSERAYPCVLLVIEWQWLIGLNGLVLFDDNRLISVCVLHELETLSDCNEPRKKTLHHPGRTNLLRPIKPTLHCQSASASSAASFI